VRSFPGYQKHGESAAVILVTAGLLLLENTGMPRIPEMAVPSESLIEFMSIAVYWSSPAGSRRIAA
jgi:hypothetical protein